MRRYLGIAVVAGSALLLTTQIGCAKRGKGITKADKEVLKEHILDELPADVTHKVDVNFEDKMHLVGWKAEPETAAPGSTVRIALYWKKTGDLDNGWKLFTHVTGDDVKQAKGNLDCVGAIRQEKAANCAQQLYGPSEWEKGKIIKDSFEYNVPADVNSTHVRFLVGAWKDDARLHIKNADANDGDNRANVVVLPTGVKPVEPPPPPKTEVPKLTAPKYGANTIKVDGKLDEKAWETAGFSGPFVGPGDGKTPSDHPVNGAAKVLWDDANLYVGFVVEDKEPASPFKATDKDPRIWEKSSAVELMIQPGNPGDNKDYFELQVDVNGAIFDTRWDDLNVPMAGGPEEEKKIFGHMDWSSNLKQAVVVDKNKKNYTVEIAIPWASFKARAGIAIPPKPGDVWRVNLYSFKDGQRAALAWSPLLGQGNFHKSSRFGEITFAGVGGVVAPAASGSVSAAASGSASAAPKASAAPAKAPAPAK